VRAISAFFFLFSFWLSIGRSHRAELAARTENGGVSYEGGDGYYRFSAVLVVSIIITIYASWRQIIRELGQRIYILVLHAHVRSGIHGTLDEARTEQREYVQRCGLWRWGRPRRRSCNERIHGSGRVGRESPAERGVQVDRPGSLLCSSSRAGRGGAPRTRTPHVASTWRCSPVAAALLSVMLLPGRLPPPYPPPVGGPLDPGSPVGWRLHV
jgi:hypothetical protein